MEWRYRVGTFGLEGICDVERKDNILVITQRDDQQASITNAIEHIANDLATKYRIRKSKLVVFSRIPKRNNYTKVTFDLKWGKLTNPEWENVTDEYIKSVIEE